MGIVQHDLKISYNSIVLCPNYQDVRAEGICLKSKYSTTGHDRAQQKGGAAPCSTWIKGKVFHTAQISTQNDVIMTKI